MRLSRLKSLCLIVAGLNLAGCANTFEEDSWQLANFEPWVKPYERSNLADPIMSMSRNPIAMSYAKHVNESREGARGADGGAGGGCGCN
jgi:hypothetical protein